ncbi:MAG: murein L,D-transpeptidase [Bryobacteraceae bacterium]|nr:murein L,D-transpeptidase [Bryobacteraceae bacterium]
MRRRVFTLITGLLVTFCLCQGAPQKRSRAPRKQLLDATSVNDSQWKGANGPAVLHAQILLARAHFSPGEIDGQMGDNFRRALNAFQEQRSLSVTGVLDEPTWTALNTDSAPVLVSYVITEQDAAGPFVTMPKEMAEQATLSSLGYESVEEGLAEKFHIGPVLLKKLNSKAELTAGQEILVPDTGTVVQAKVTKIVVKRSGTVTAFDAKGTAVAHYPCSSGSEHDPLPVGTWKVTTVVTDPPFFYNPKLFWDAKPDDTKAKIAAGPNNPVGVAWIDLSKPHYGIHGTPAPAGVGHSQSHGCIRLTNWDVRELAGLVGKGTVVICQE